MQSKTFFFFFFFFLWLELILSMSNIPVCQNIRIFLRLIQKSICKTKKFRFFKVCSFMHSILGRGSFNRNDSISEVWHGSDQPVALLLLNRRCLTVVSRWEHKVLQNLLVDGCIDFGLDKTQWANISRRHSTRNHHWLWKLHTGLQAA